MLTDNDYMRRCFVLAELGRHTCRPNPAVGCVLVLDGNVVGEGWHHIAGQAHAEIHALQQAGTSALGATAYVSLEPCAHQGRTGSCAAALIDAGIKRLVYGMVDPNPLVSGRGLQLLQAAGVEVSGPMLETEARSINPGFNKRMQQGMPYVRCKTGMSLDGRTAMASGESKWITGALAREDVQKLRARSCAILTGVSTILTDDPALTVRLAGYQGNQPMRVVADSNGRTPQNARILQEAGTVLLATTKALSQQYKKMPAAVSLVTLPDGQGRVDLKALLQLLAQDYACNEVLVEAGATLIGALLQAGLVDELVTYVAPVLLGHEGQPMAVLPGLVQLADGLRFTISDVAMLGKDCRIRSLPDS